MSQYEDQAVEAEAQGRQDAREGKPRNEKEYPHGTFEGRFYHNGYQWEQKKQEGKCLGHIAESK